MKITIEPENEQERKDFGEVVTFEGVFEFGLVGRRLVGDLYESAFSRIHQADKHVLLGRLAELTERVRGGTGH